MNADDKIFKLQQHASVVQKSQEESKGPPVSTAASSRSSPMDYVKTRRAVSASAKRNHIKGDEHVKLIGDIFAKSLDVMHFSYQTLMPTYRAFAAASNDKHHSCFVKFQDFEKAKASGGDLLN